MSGAMKPLKDVIWFQEFIMNAKSPLLGLLVGAALCAVIQSSSAAVGILQALAMQGLMPLYFASFLVCGINIGSAMPTILASMNARNNAKRAAMIYLIYNVVGAVLMTFVTLVTPYTEFIARIIPDPAFQVSMIHILFKVVSAAVLLPCTNLVVKLTYKLDNCCKSSVAYRTVKYSVTAVAYTQQIHSVYSGRKACVAEI